MEKTDDMPMWVFLAFSAIERRTTALWLVWGSVLFTLYCVPWSSLAPANEWIKQVFLIEDWSWFAMMVPLTAWYSLAFRWLDKNAYWQRNA